jgi:hypothetical protein
LRAGRGAGRVVIPTITTIRSFIMQEISDPQLARLIREYHAAEAEADRTEDLSTAAEKKRLIARQALTAAMQGRVILDDDTSLVDYRSWFFEGRFYSLQGDSANLHVQYEEPAILTD